MSNEFEQLLRELENQSIRECVISAQTCRDERRFWKVLSKNRSLETVRLEQIGLDGGWKAISEIPSLSHVHLIGMLNATTARQLIIAPHWQTLDVSETPKLGPRGVKALSISLLGQASTLQVFNISGCKMGNFGAQALGVALPQTLVSLDVSHNALGHDGVWKLATHLPLSLQELNLSFNKCSDDGCLEIARRGFPSLRILNLDGNDIGDTAMDALAAQIARSSTLHELHLAHNQVSDIGAGKLAQQALYHNGSLRLLDLSHNRIKDSGCLAFAEALKVSTRTRLEKLVLSNNQIGDEGAGSFVEALDHIKTLVSLDLSENENVSEARTRILGILLKHRIPFTPRGGPCNKSTCTTHDDMKTERIEENEYDDVAAEGFSEDEEEMILRGRDLLANLSIDSSSCVEFPAEYISFLTDDFDVQLVVSYGAFGQLFTTSDEQHPDKEYFTRRLLLGPAGSLTKIRESVTAELKELKHENILPIAGFAHDSISICTIHEAIERVSLRELLCDEYERAKMSWGIRTNIAISIAKALTFLHTGGSSRRCPCFHGDVQPSNIFVSGEEYSTIQLIDCGLSRILATDRNRFLSGEVVFGSRSYRCPRYERGSFQYDNSSDIFSFGIVLLELITGRLQRSATKMGGSLDFYYDYVLPQRPLVFDCLVKQVLPIPSKNGLTQLAASCLRVNPMKRPSAESVAHILELLRAP